MDDGKRGREDPGCEKEQGSVKSGPFDPDVRHGVRLPDRAGRHALRGCGSIERERGGCRSEGNGDLDQLVSPPARGGVEAELLCSPVGKFPRRSQPLCDLLLACTLIDRASDGQKWAKLHDKLKAVLDDFDRKTESET